MSISGNLQTMQLAELLQWLSQGTKSGTLVIDNGTVKKEIFFRAGKIVSTASTDPKEHLGHFLVSHGYIDERELSRAVQMQEQSGMLLGKILVTHGSVSEADLDRLLRLKAEESIYDVFQWPKGEFRFIEGERPQLTMIPIALDVTGIVLEAARRQDEWQRIQEVVPSPSAIPVSVVGDLAEDPELSPGERKILELVDDQRTVEEIALQTHSSEFLVSSVLYRQAAKRRLKVVKPRWRPEPEPGARTGSAGSGVVDAGALVAEAERFLEENDYGQALRHLRAARSLEPEASSVKKAVEAGETRLKEALVAEGVTLDAVPVLSADLQNLTASKISPQEGFMLTRINGSYDIASILKISPMPQLDGLLVFWRLMKAGHIRLKIQDR